MINKDKIYNFAKILISQDIQCVPKKPGEKCPAILNWTKKMEKRKLEDNFVYNDYDGLLIVTGKNSGLTVLDFDSKELARNFVQLFPALKKFPIVKTRKGVHIYLPYIKDLKSTANAELHLDVRNDGACVVAPPSPLIYKKGEENEGGEYCFVNNNIEKDLQNFKKNIYDMFNKHKEEINEIIAFYEFLKEIKGDITVTAGTCGLASSDFLPIREGARHNNLIKLIGTLANKLKTFDEQQIKMLCKIATIPPMEDKDVEDFAKKYLEYHEQFLKDKGSKNVKSKDNNASESTSYKNYVHGPELINRLLAENIYYAEKLGRWVKVKDPSNLCRCVSTNGEEGVIVLKFCDENKITTRVEIILDQIKHNEELKLKNDVEVVYELMDNHFYILFKDCIYDLVSESILDLNEKVNIDIVIDDICEHFLIKREVNSNSVNNLLFEHIFGPIKCDFLKCIVHNLDLKSPFQYFVIIVGEQRTGKSTILKILMNHLGKNRCAYIDMEDDLKNEYYKTMLRNKNFCIIDDVDLMKISPNIFKKMIKGSMISARALYKNPEVFEFTSALIIANNYVPTFLNTQGLERRCLIFNTGEELTKELEQRLLKGEHLTDAEREEFILMLVKAKQMLKKDVDFMENLSKEYKEQLACALDDVFVLQRFIKENYEFDLNSSEKVNDICVKFKTYVEEQELDNPILRNITRNAFRKDLSTIKIGERKLKIIKKYGMYYVENLIEKEKLISKRALTGDNDEDIKAVDDSILTTDVTESTETAEEDNNVEKTFESLAKHNDNSEKLERIKREEEEEAKMLKENKLAKNDDVAVDEFIDVFVNNVEADVKLDVEDVIAEQSKTAVNENSVYKDKATEALIELMMNERAVTNDEAVVEKIYEKVDSESISKTTVNSKDSINKATIDYLIDE